jgi:hypothetical protein
MALLPAAAQPKTVDVYQRRMEKQIEKILSDLPHKHHSTFLIFLHSHVQEKMYLANGLLYQMIADAEELEKDLSYQQEMASVMANSDDPVLIERGRRTLAEIGYPPASNLGVDPNEDPPLEEPSAEYPNGRFI